MKVRKFLIFTISLLVVATAEGGKPPSMHHDQLVCAKPQFCSPDGPAVRFPFRLVGKHPDHCGYNSSYNLHCDKLNRAILELSSSSRNALVVTSIDYSFQRMVTGPLETCFAKQLKDLDITKSSFRYYFEDADALYNVVQPFSFYNCSLPDYDFRTTYSSVECLTSVAYGYFVHQMPTLSTFSENYDELKSCRKMYDTNLIPRYVFYYDTVSIELSWSEPYCGSCELNRTGFCMGKHSNSNQVDCLKIKLDDTSHYGILKILGISGPIIGCFLLLPAVGALFFLHSKMEEQKEKQKRITKFLEDYAAVKPTRFSYADLKKITNSFKNKLGAGAYGDVFKGQMSKNIFVAVKLLHNSSGNGEEFINEVGTIGTIHHVNVVRLLGFCADGFKRGLVYEFLPNGSLDKFIFPHGDQKPDHVLGMRKFEDIAKGIARGIEYLHQGCQQRILHFDIKPHNILLDKNYCPKISDFGLSKLCEKEKSMVSMTTARGTMGYIAPEVFSRQFGNVSYKSDIYSFGMLLLEMVGRRKNIDAAVQNMSQVYFPEWVYERLVHGEELRIQIEEDGEEEIARRLAIVGLWCIQWNPVDRPSISTVLQMLRVNDDKLSLPSNPFASSNAVNPGLAAVYESE